MQDGRYTAILIDDESWTRDVLKCIGKWEQLGIDIIAEASDGDYGLELIIGLQPDIIISDVKMPNMDGICLAEILRERNCGAKLLFVSGYDDYELVRNALRLRANDYLLKPVKPDELNRQLERCVKELRQERQSRDQSRLYLGNALEEPWILEYRQLQTSLHEALRAHNTTLISKRLTGIQKLVEENTADICPKEIVIYIYFELYGLLHRYVTGQGFSFSEIVGNTEKNLVFGSDTSLQEMMESIRDMYALSLERMEFIRREKNRIDIKEIRRYVEANYTQNITLEETAQRFFISKEYLSKVFKSEIGHGFSGYVTELKMRKAKRLLLEDGMPIKEIAEVVGYKEVANFYKVFKRHYGMTPGEMLENRTPD